MASIIKDITMDAPADAVWDAVADFGAVHTRFAAGFVVGVTLEPGARIVTFGDGQVAREVFVGVDHEARRLAYSIESERLAHHNAAFQVIEEGAGRCRLVWTVDLLPDVIAPYMAGRMDAGLVAAKATLERPAA